VNFDIHLGKCGMSSSDGGASGSGLQLEGAGGGGSSGLQQGHQQQPNGVFIENTIIIQYDPLVQEIYDQARKLRCTWYDYYEKSVTFRPYNVDMLDAVTANFLGDNIQCWMQIQVGKGPWSSEVAGIVKIGQTMTMVLAIKDDENRFDMLVRNCVAHDGKHQPIQLVDEYGCVTRPKIMGKFQKVRNFGPAATVVSYAHFQAFKFPDSMNVHFQCVIQVCRYECPEPACQQPAAGELAGTGPGAGATNAGAGGGPAQGDYATSGTEMVASKELVPHGQPNYFNPTLGNHSNPGAHHHQQQQYHGSNVNLKLDESQGRVQVKLDTSMLAGLGSNGRPPVGGAAAHVGPLPPHLLHTAGSQAHQQQELLARSQLGPAAGYQRLQAPVAGPQAAVLLTSGGPVASRHQATIPGGGRPQPPAGEPQLVSYSPQLSTAQGVAASRRSAAYTSRLGETVAGGGANSSSEHHHKQPQTQSQQQQAHQQQQLQAHPLDQLAPYEAEYPLSLIASPRGFRLGSLIGTAGDPTTNGALLQRHLHRVKRDGAATGATKPTDQSSSSSSKRQARHLPRANADSTSVQTHKSIQVVSPDDVAFSLLEPDEQNQMTVATFGSSPPRKSTLAGQQQQDSSSVCFSASRFLWAVFVTLTALISSIVIVAYVILRQRSQLEEKLSAVYTPPEQFEPASGMSFNYSTPMVSQENSQQQQQPQQQQLPVSAASNLNGYMHFGDSPSSALGRHQLAAATGQRTICSDNNKRQQEEEVQQRNKYLARLYSQFSPASYWR
jgi:hypothetical protein